MIIVYTKPQCPQCDWTKRKMAERGITYTAIDITTDADAEAYVKSVAAQHNLTNPSMPLVVTDDDWWFGFKLDKIRGLTNDS